MPDSSTTRTAQCPSYRSQITAAVLAGGRATRMGGDDKGLIRVGARAMVEHIVAALTAQVGQIVINANRNLDRYQALSPWPVVADSVAGFAGPLAGMAAVMRQAHTPLIMSVPCDSPLICPDLAERLWLAIEDSDGDPAEIAVAHDGQRMQPVFALVRGDLLPSLLAYLEAGERKIDRWYAHHRTVEVDFSDHQDTFLNINTPAERDALEARLLATSSEPAPDRSGDSVSGNEA